MSKRHADDLALYATLGIILGGRLGYVIFCAPDMFLNPIRILEQARREHAYPWR